MQVVGYFGSGALRAAAANDLMWTSERPQEARQAPECGRGAAQTLMSGVRHRKRKVGCETASGADRSNVALMCGGGLLSTDSLQIVLGGAVMCLAHLQIFCIPGAMQLGTVPYSGSWSHCLCAVCCLPVLHEHMFGASAVLLRPPHYSALHRRPATLLLSALPRCNAQFSAEPGLGRAPTRGLWVIVGHTRWVHLCCAAGCSPFCIISGQT